MFNFKSYLVVDVETTTRSKRSKFRATPHDPVNEIVMTATKEPHNPDPTLGMIWSGYNILVGHNIGFDLLYLRKHIPFDGEYHSWIADKQIWDTQIAEYILTGHKHKFSSLDSLAEKYGGTTKNTDVKEHWERGGRTEDIPVNVLKDYLFEDVRNTELVFLEQLHTLSGNTSLLPVLASAMEFRLATVEMECNGLYFNQDIATQLLKGTNKKLTSIQQNLLYTLTKRLPNLDKPNLNSNDQIALCIYGGTYKSKSLLPYTGEDGQFVRYKTGDRKGDLRLKAHDVEHHIDPWIEGLPKEQTPTGKLKVDDHTLHQILGKTLSTQPSRLDLRTFIVGLLTYRGLTKEVGTYLLPFSEEHAWPHDSCIHTTFNHAATNTGRLSSSKPNLQNITRGGTGSE